MATNMKPNLFIVGVAKAATTSLYFYLRQHPDIYMADKKEPNYYTKDFIHSDYKNYNEYLGLFKTNKKIVGESSVSYFHYADCATDIFRDSPTAKIIIVLRDPVDRLFSHVNMLLMRGFISEEDLIDQKILVDHFVLNPFDASYYYDRLVKFYDIFGKDNVNVILYDELISNPRDVLKRILLFLNLEDKFEFNTENKYNQSGIPKFEFINRLIFGDYLIKRLAKKILPVSLLTKTAMYIQSKNLKKPYAKNQEFRRKFISFYLDDIEKVEDLLEINLDAWKNIERYAMD